ncbi:MAG: Holliday junction resolvase RuvX [Bacilli bacterium]|nr:Holliday junction resolvase RuvX [Bacilli bacterium]
MMRYLGLDLGSKTLGMALSDKTGLIATSLKIVRHNEEYDKLVDEVLKVVDEYQVEGIVLGLPKNMNNSIGFKGELSIEFKEKLEEVLSIPVILEDERLTTKEAENILISNDTSRKKRKKVIDSMAASIILQSYLDKRKEK